MWPIETGMDSSRVVLVSSLLHSPLTSCFCQPTSPFQPSLLNHRVQRKRVLAGGNKVHLRDFGKLSVHRYIGCTGEDIQAEAEGATSGFRGDKPGRKDDQGDED